MSNTFAEVLCKDKFHYLYKGKCLAMEKLSKSETWTPNTIDPDHGPGRKTPDGLPDGARDRLRTRKKTDGG